MDNTSINIKLHKAENCQKELSESVVSWFNVDRLYHQRKLLEYITNNNQPKGPDDKEDDKPYDDGFVDTLYPETDDEWQPPI